MNVCNTKPDATEVLFDFGDNKTVSHNFEIKQGEVYVLNAFGLLDTDELVVELVTGCGVGTIFSPYVRPACGTQAKLTLDSPRVVIPYTGRYRVLINTGSSGDFRVLAQATAAVGFNERTKTDCDIPDGAEIVDAILASPAATAGLCAGLDPCITPKIDAAVAAQIVPAVAVAAHNNPFFYVLLEDAFGVDIGYAFPL